MRELLPFLVVGVALLAGAGRLMLLQQERGPGLRERAQRQQTMTQSIPAQRGDIIDARGRVLAGSVRRNSVFVDPGLVEDPQREAALVAGALGLKAADVEAVIRENAERRFAWLARQVADEPLAAFRVVRRKEGLRAFGIQQEPQRVYPHDTLAAHVLGFVGIDGHGLAGIELAFDHRLCGRDGQRSVTVDVRRRRLRNPPGSSTPPKDGAAVVLTLDAHIQQRAEYHLAAAVTDLAAEWGCAIVMDPQSGEVLAMAVSPGYDPSDPVPAHFADRDAAMRRLRNRAVSDAIEPGSIFKPFVAAPALDDGLVRLDETLVIDGPRRRFGGRTIHDVHPYGTLAFWEVISKSSNIGMGLLGERCGNERLYDYVRRFGFGEVTDIALPGEHAGLLHALDDWTSFSTQSVPIGQEVAVTPIQVATAFAAIANDGTLYRPRIVRGVVAADGTVLEDRSEPEPVRRILSEDAARAFRMEALVRAAEPGGTAHRAALPDCKVFGKTGTAQVARKDGRGYEPGAYVGSFVGGAPADDPRAIVLVSVYRPAGSAYYGGTIAAPVAGAILGDTLAYLRVAASTE